ncbi:MAG: hypothetical protein LUC49_04345 [Prevotella sp.]|nr:hypothetical protein [Prevotella sp.]
MKRIFTYLSILAVVVAFVACGGRVKDAKRIHRVPPIFPDYTEVTVPVDIAPLCFNFADESVKRMDVVVRGSKGGELHSSGSYADFSVKAWHKLTERNKGGELIVTVCVKRGGEWLQYDDFKIYVSSYPLTDYGVTYRRIAPGYEAGGNIGIWQRDIHSFKESPILTEYSTPTYCMNCHTANRCDPKEFSIQIRGERGATILQIDGKQKFLSTKTDSTRAACSYTYWHPSGKYIAYATNAVFQAFFVGTYKPKEVYHTFSDIVLLDTRTDELILDPHLQTEDLEIFPAFSADGKTLFYSTSKPCRMPAEYLKVKCSLCAIGFDEKTGTFVGEPDTLLNGPADDMSYINARPSYDGRWLMYTRCSRSNFSVEQRDADLWLMDLRTKEVKELTVMNSDFSDGWHNWSTDSHWVVFASKRGDSFYGKLYFASIDDEGNATKPFLLPQRNPREYYRLTFDAYNAPDFTKTPVKFNIREARKNLFKGDRTQVEIRQ